MTACPMIELTEGQMETLRAEAGGASAKCSAKEKTGPPSPPPPPPSPPEENLDSGMQWNLAAVIPISGFWVFMATFSIGACIHPRGMRAAYVRAKAAERARASSRPAAPNTVLNAPVSYGTAPQPQQQMQMVALPVCHGAVFMQVAGSPQQPVAHGGAAGYEYAQQPVAMGQFIR